MLGSAGRSLCEGEYPRAAAQSFIPDKGLGVKVGAVIGQVEAGHGIEIVGALEITEG